MTNLIGNVNLKNNSDYQAIYASQLYGTFFMIYANFTCGKEDKGKGHLLKEIELKIINYKGLLNLGIAKSKFKPKTKRQRVRKPNGQNVVVPTPFGGTINVRVRVLHDSNPNDLTIKNINHYCPKNSFIEVNRSVQRINPDITKPVTNNVFDEEFYYREGVKRDFKENFKKRKPIPDELMDAGSGVGGWICPRSKNMVM